MNPHSRLWPSREGGKKRGKGKREAEEDTAHKNVVTARPLIPGLSRNKDFARRAPRDKSVWVRMCAIVSVCTRQRRRQSSYSRNADDVLGPLTLLASSSSILLMVLHADEAGGHERCQLAIFTACNSRFNSVDCDPLENCRWLTPGRTSNFDSPREERHERGITSIRALTS